MESPYGAAARCAAALWLCVAATLVHAQDISIVSPASEETVHSNPGEVTVVVSYKGARASSMVRILVDGQPAGPAQPGDTFLLQGIERGAHTLQAQLLTDGKVVAASAPVTFYLWHASILLPQPQVAPHRQ